MDKIYSGFLKQSLEQATQLAADSDVLSILDTKGNPPFRFLLQFSGIDYLVQSCETGEVEINHEPVLVDLYFPPDYLRSVDPELYLKIVSLLTPGFFHPNVRIPFGLICLGHDFLPGTLLGDLAFHIHDIITYQNATVDERDAYNPEACRYLRQYPDILKQLRRPPIRRRNLKVQVTVESLEKGGTL